jgi:hypothetical protein
LTGEGFMDNMANMLDIQKLEKSVVEIKGEIETTAFEAFRDQAVKHLAEHVEIDGFRKGHVPANVALKNLSESQILEEMAQKALSVEFPKIIKENKIDAIGYPSIQITKLASGNPLGFTIKVAVLPEVVLPTPTHHNSTHIQILTSTQQIVYLSHLHPLLIRAKQFIIFTFLLLRQTRHRRQANSTTNSSKREANNNTIFNPGIYG